MRVEPGRIRAGLEIQRSYIEHLVSGAIPTDGVQYSSVATFGTTAVNVFSKLIDPGYTLGLSELEVGLEHRFTGLNGSYVGTLAGYYWQVQPIYTKMDGSGAPYEKTGTTINITGTYIGAVGTLTTMVGTFSGYVPVGSVPYAPFQLTLVARGIQAAVCTGEIKNTSYVRLVGNIIPGA